MDAIYNVSDVKSSFSVAFLNSLNYVTISTNNKICNENLASTGSLAGSIRVFLNIPFHLSSTCHAHEPANLLRVEIDVAGTRPGFRQKKVESWSKTVQSRLARRRSQV